MQIPVVECHCGNQMVLSQAKNTEKLASICPNCFRSLMWRDGKPVSINSKGEATQMKFLGVTEIQ